jgi:hypothetical protein
MSKNTITWMYCDRCGWQTDEPDTVCKPTCPDCWAQLHYVRMTKDEFTKVGPVIRETSVKRFLSESAGSRSVGLLPLL